MINIFTFGEYNNCFQFRFFDAPYFLFHFLPRVLPGAIDILPFQGKETQFFLYQQLFCQL
ncbi:MAG TPA: hypothetical protein DHV48_19815 [Prolixibacteraceae bacterium]|nr:hypothetical protein [Prolixibacteraceae bacterium]